MDSNLSEALALEPHRPSSIAFPLLAAILFLFFVSASVPSPLFVVFQGRWGFSPGMLTVAFSIYSLVLLVTLLLAGSLSDHLGRKPVIVAALAIQVASMALFLTADGIGGLLAARIVQGLSMGVVNGALSAAVIEAAPPARKALGSLLTSISPLAGLATGAFVTGALLGVTDKAEI
jgi:MFS family permease